MPVTVPCNEEDEVAVNNPTPNLWGMQNFCSFITQYDYNMQVRVQSEKKEGIIKLDCLCVDHIFQRKMALTCSAEESGIFSSISSKSKSWLFTINLR